MGDDYFFFLDAFLLMDGDFLVLGPVVSPLLCSYGHRSGGENGLPTRFTFNLDLMTIFFMGTRTSALNKPMDHYFFFVLDAFGLPFLCLRGHGKEGENGFATRVPFGLDLGAIFFLGMRHLPSNGPVQIVDDYFFFPDAFELPLFLCGRGQSRVNACATRFPFDLDLGAIFLLSVIHLLSNKQISSQTRSQVQAR